MSSLDHLKSNYINDIALQLNEDVYDANGELSDEEIFDRLMQAIVKFYGLHYVAGSSGYEFMPLSVAEHAHNPALTLYQAARLILGVWQHKDRGEMDAIAQWATVLPPQVLPSHLEP